MTTIQQINSNFESTLASMDVRPGIRNEKFVEALVYVVLPLCNPRTQGRGGANKHLFSLLFDGAFMSTRSQADGRHAVHISMPFLMFMSSKAQIKAPSFQTTKRGKDGGKDVWETQLEEINWNHKVKDDETNKIQVGTKLPYNFRINFTSAQLSGLGLNGASDPNSVWDMVQEIIPTNQPQLHLILSVSPHTMELAKIQKVFNQEEYACAIELKPSDILSVQWVDKDNPLYDKGANIPKMLVDNRSNYEKVEVSNGDSTISIDDVGLVDPQKSMRNLLIKHVNKVSKGGRDVILTFIEGMDGKLRCWWDKLPASQQAKFLSDWETLAPKGKAKGVKEAVVETQKEAAKPSTPKAEPTAEVQKEASVESLNEAEADELAALFDAFSFEDVESPKPSVNKPVVKVGGNISAKLSIDSFDDLDEI